jgi:hypothetical protein
MHSPEREDARFPAYPRSSVCATGRRPWCLAVVLAYESGLIRPGS